MELIVLFLAETSDLLKCSSSVEIPPAKVATVRVLRRGVSVYTVLCIFTPQVVRTVGSAVLVLDLGTLHNYFLCLVSFVTFANKQNATCFMNTLCLVYTQRTQHNKQGTQYQYRALAPNGKLTKHTADQLRSPLPHKPR
jgi:hypothetical protein